MSHSYPSGISREQFALILPTLESGRRRTKPRTVDLCDVFCGALYVLKSGCQWRMLPTDFPDWRTCYKYFRQWSAQPDPAEGGGSRLCCPNPKKIVNRLLLTEVFDFKHFDHLYGESYDARIRGIHRFGSVEAITYATINVGG